MERKAALAALLALALAVLVVLPASGEVDAAVAAPAAASQPAAAAADAKGGSSNGGGKAPAAEPAPAPAAPSSSSSSSSAKSAAPALYAPAEGCTPPTLPKLDPQAPPVPALPAGKRPNFIIVLTDDQGWDDIGMHQPQEPGKKPTWVNTPNLDKFLRGSTEFDNFYVSPMCSQSRAQLLTGRDYPRTGTMLINGGYDYLNRAELTSAEFFAAAGYATAHFGKWHNGRTLGYEPWSLGFGESWLPSSHVHLDNLMRHNGKYVQTKGLMEQDLMDTMLGWLKGREGSSQPFYVFYAPHAIHQGFMRPGQGPRWQRPAPEPYKSKYRNMKPPLAPDTAEVWAMLEYMDDVLGRLFDFVEGSPLKKDTYVMVMSDNGAELFPTERYGKAKLVRMPSGMQGFKKSVEEGGIRNYLMVKGPGVAAGVVDSTLTSITDVLPTMADLAGLSGSPKPAPWDGISLKNVLLADTGKPASGARGTSKASSQQLDRYVFELGPACWSPDSVPELGADRYTKKPQKLLNYDNGGVDGQGFARCVGLRWKNYKWLGESGAVYRIDAAGDNHIELPCNEVTGAEKKQVADQMAAMARKHFESMVADDHSFSKPTFQLGLGEWSVTNVLPDGAHERTPGRIQLLPNGLSGFAELGDSACFALEVNTAGKYKVEVMYTSQVQATFKLSVGEHSKIKDGSAPSLTVVLPVSYGMKSKDIGSLQLPASAGKRTEACLQLVGSKDTGKPVFQNLANVRFELEGGKGDNWVTGGVQEEEVDAKQRKQQQAPKQQQQQPKQQPGDKVQAERSAANGLKPVYDMDWIEDDSTLNTLELLQQGGAQALHPNLNATAGMAAAEQQAYEAAASREAAAAAKESARVGAAPQSPGEAAWQRLRRAYLWPDGQQRGAMESLFTPYESEGIYECAECQPEL